MNRFTIRTLTFLLCLLPAVAAFGDEAGAGKAHSDNSFAQLMKPYEAVRQSLLHDKLDVVPSAAAALKAGLEALGKTDQTAALGAENAETFSELLPKMVQAADDLAAAKDLAAARDAFYALSRPLVRYREMRTGQAGELPVVAYCAMAKRSWLQPEGELGNPYHGQAMARCGEVVSR